MTSKLTRSECTLPPGRVGRPCLDFTPLDPKKLAEARERFEGRSNPMTDDELMQMVAAVSAGASPGKFVHHACEAIPRLLAENERLRCVLTKHERALRKAGFVDMAREARAALEQGGS